jgi:type IV secretory pathway VirJ component
MKVASSLCIFGESEKTPVPGLLKNTTVNIAVIPGDHHYRGNATLIVQTMKNKNAF